MKSRRSKCRIWWPKELIVPQPPPDIGGDALPSSFSVLFGWFISTSSSLDVVVAFMSTYSSLSEIQSQLPVNLHCTNANVPTFLKDKTSFSPLGYFSTFPNNNAPHPVIAMNGDQSNSIRVEKNDQNREDKFQEAQGQQNCGCNDIDGVIMHCASQGNGNWVKLVYDSEDYQNAVHLIPKFHHIHCDSEVISYFDAHVIVYETPTFGASHLQTSFWSRSMKAMSSIKKPNWLNELHYKQCHIDLGTTIHAMNCAATAKLLFQSSVPSERFHKLAQAIALFTATCSSLVYITLQALYGFLSYASHLRVYAIVAKVFPTTSRSIRFRCSQFLYWPVYLGGESFRSGYSVEYGEKAAMRRHSLWTNMIVDILLGNVTGLALLLNVESVRSWVFSIVYEITNNVLRSGCVWLMGVPAGFKLNIELARILGSISLNTIQIWSTLWFFLGLIFDNILEGLSVAAILFGFTTAADFVSDLIILAAFHVSALHWIVSLLYSWQLQSIASLWRLFRGQKWNPLRQRLDSYDYSVEQHIVGSLLFTPLLLLIPTTSVFYIFLSLLSTSISVLCIFIEVIVTMVHATPYLKILLWILSPKRFPSGIWFEIVSQKSNSAHVEDARSSKNSSSTERLQQRNADIGSTSLVLQLHSHYLTLGEVVRPHYRSAFSGVSPSFLVSAVCGILTGQRFPTTLGVAFPAKLPFYSISPKEYWHLCYSSILSNNKSSLI